MHEPGLSLSHASAALADDLAPDAAWWSDDDVELDDEPGALALDIPVDEAAGLDPGGWNIARVAAAATIVPALLCGAPALAAPPLDRHLSPPTRADGDQDSIWHTLVDRQVTLVLSDGTSFQGTVLGVVQGQLVCARATDGSLVYVDPDEVRNARVEGLAGAKQAQTGSGAIVFGSIATAIGSGLAIAAGGVMISCGLGFEYSYSSLCPYYTIPLGVTSLVNLSVGIPLLVHGVRKRKAYRASLADDSDELRPTFSGFVAPSRTGLMAGVGVTF
jgi:hypothetical protein